MKRSVILIGEQQRRTAHQYVNEAAPGDVMTIRPAVKKRVQENKYHAMIDDIADQTQYAGKRWDRDDMKRIMVDEFAEAMRLAGTPLHHDGRLIPSENGRRVIQLGIDTSSFWVKEASEFIEFLYAWGSERDVIWSEPVEFCEADTAPAFNERTE